jgi:aldehyde dehydrogenase (NAD+)
MGRSGGTVVAARFTEAEVFLSAGGSACGIANVDMGTRGAEIGGACHFLPQ